MATENERLEVMSYVILMALAVYIILQRRVWQSLERRRRTPEAYGDKKSLKPTGNKIFRAIQAGEDCLYQRRRAFRKTLPAGADIALELGRALKDDRF